MLKQRGDCLKILDGTAGLPASKITNIVPAIVTQEPWYPEALTAKFIQDHLASEGVTVDRFQLMSIGDLDDPKAEQSL